MGEEKGPEPEKRGSPSETERFPASPGQMIRDSEAWALSRVVREVESRGDPREGPHSLRHTALVERFLSLKEEVAMMRVRLEEQPASDSAEWNPRRKVGCPERGRVISANSFSRHWQRAHGAAHSGDEANS